MDLSELIIHDDVLARMGHTGAAATARALHAEGDCQTCVKPLRPGGITLCADVPAADRFLATASLHHAACRPSGWNDSGVVMVARKSVTYRVSYWAVEVPLLGAVAVMAVNPGMELVAIRPLDGGWYPSAQRQYLRAGLCALDSPAQAPHTPAITARISAQGVIAVTVPVGETYPEEGGCAAPPLVVALARRQRSLVLAVTHANSPAMADDDALNAVLGDPLTVMGRIAVSG